MEPICPVCRNTGFEIRTASDGVAVAAQCTCRLEDRGGWRLRAARIPKRYDHCNLENFELLSRSSHAAALEHARAWVEKWGDPELRHGLLFLGKPGTGKTHLAVGIARELALRKDARVLFSEYRELLKDLQATYGSAAVQDESEVLAPLWSVELLILDDLGAGRLTPWAQDVMHDILGQRYNDEKLVVMTSNRLTGDETDTPEDERKRQEGLTLRDRLGDALMSRVYEMCVIVRVEGPDYRREMLNARHRS